MFWPFVRLRKGPHEVPVLDFQGAKKEREKPIPGNRNPIDLPCADIMEESKRTTDATGNEGETWWWKTTKVDKKQRKAEKADKAAFKGKKGLQTGTGLHLDCNPYNLWEKELDEKGTAKTPLDRLAFSANSSIVSSQLPRFRVFQAQIPLRDQERGDSGLEVIPGFAPWCEMYYKLTDRHGRNLARWGTYNTKVFFNKFKSHRVLIKQLS